MKFACRAVFSPQNIFFGGWGWLISCLSIHLAALRVLKPRLCKHTLSDVSKTETILFSLLFPSLIFEPCWPKFLGGDSVNTLKVRATNPFPSLFYSSVSSDFFHLLSANLDNFFLIR